MAQKKFGNYEHTEFSEAQPSFKYPHKRHYIQSLGKPQTKHNSVVVGVSKQTVKEEIDQIKQGLAHRFGKQKNRFEVASGRIYGYHNRNFYPVEGPGIYLLSGQEYGLLKQFLTNEQYAGIGFSALQEKGQLSAASIERILAIATLYKKMLKSSQEEDK